MAKFVYGMQNLLNLKLKTEDQAKMEFGKAQSELNEQIDILDDLKNRRAQFMNEGTLMRQSGHLQVRDITDNQYYVAVMDSLIRKQQEVIKGYEARVEIERRKLTVAMQERKMHEKLREKALQQYFEEERAAEYKETDQRTSFTYGQKQNDLN